ncbi:hypothetical protein JCM8097_001056 [Rhodosporidiobolus ruineniae]
MSTEQAVCLVCTKTATTRCTRCKAPFCSSSCLNLFWPHHKVQCKSGSEAIVFPPFAKDEAAALKVIIDRKFAQPWGETTISIMEWIRAHLDCLQSLLATLTRTPPAHTKQHTALVALLRFQAHNYFRTEEMRDHPLSPAQNPSQGTSAFVATLLVPELAGTPTVTVPDADPLVVAKGFLLDTLVAHAMLHEYQEAMGRQIHLLEWSVAAYASAKEKLKGLPVTEKTRQFLGEQLRIYSVVVEALLPMARDGMI